jgi:hypothetical protein
MKRTNHLLFALIVLLNFASCQLNHEQVEKEILAGNYDIYSELPRCECGELVENNDGLLTLSESTIFTGTCFRYYPETDKIMEERQILNGRYNGYFFIYDLEGNLMTKTLYKDGFLLSAKGENAKQCACADLKDYEDSITGVKYKIFNTEYFTGTCTNYYEDSTIALTAEFRAGLNHGVLKVFDKNGHLIVSEKYDEGELVE